LLHLGLGRSQLLAAEGEQGRGALDLLRQHVEVDFAGLDLLQDLLELRTRCRVAGPIAVLLVAHEDSRCTSPTDARARPSRNCSWTSRPTSRRAASVRTRPAPSRTIAKPRPSTRSGSSRRRRVALRS